MNACDEQAFLWKQQSILCAAVLRRILKTLLICKQHSTQHMLPTAFRSLRDKEKFPSNPHHITTGLSSKYRRMPPAEKQPSSRTALFIFKVMVKDYGNQWEKWGKIWMKTRKSSFSQNI